MKLFDGVMVGMVAAAVCSAIATVRVWKEEKCKGIVGEREIFELDVP